MTFVTVHVDDDAVPSADVLTTESGRRFIILHLGPGCDLILSGLDTRAAATMASHVIAALARAMDEIAETTACSTS